MDILTQNAEAYFCYTDAIFHAEILLPYYDLNLPDINIKFAC